MKRSTHIKIRISFLLVLLVMCAVMEPAMRTLETCEQISVLDEAPADETSSEEVETEEFGEEEQDLLFEPLQNFAWNVHNARMENSYFPPATQKPIRIDFPPELV